MSGILGCQEDLLFLEDRGKSRTLSLFRCERVKVQIVIGEKFVIELQ